MKKINWTSVKYIIRALWQLLFWVLVIWNYIDGDMLKAIFWLIFAKIDLDDIWRLAKIDFNKFN